MAEQLFEYNIVDKIKNIISEQNNALYYIVMGRTLVFPGYENLVDEELCKKLGIGVISLPNEGGTIVSGKGSIAIGHFSENLHNQYKDDFIDVLMQWLSDFGLNVTLDINDVLIDKTYKVASSSSRRFGDILFSAIHISYSVDLELIKKICTKPMYKIPKGLQDYGITEEQLLNKVKELLTIGGARWVVEQIEKD